MATVVILDALIAACTLTTRLTTILFNGLLRTRRSRWSSLVFGWLDPGRPMSTLLAALTNLLCVLAALDFAYRGHFFYQSRDLSFSRVGYVDAISARVVIRAVPAPQAVGVEIRLSKADAGPKETTVEIISVSAESDFVGTVVFQDLFPDTQYVYTTNTSIVGTFRTQKQAPKVWSLVSTSCLKPFYPYNPLDHALRVRGFEHLSKYLEPLSVDFMLFLGDFIYIDLPVAVGWGQEHYTAAYRQVYASPSWTPALRSLPWMHLYDDHEIINDWAANETGLYKVALKPYWDYQGHANPPPTFGEGSTYFTFKHGDVAFFVLDTRRYRSAEALPDGPEKTMLGSEQLGHLGQWLATERAWKVVVSSVPFTRNWRGPDAADSWAGYLWEREIVLDMMRATDGVVILSGDRHEHATTVFPPGDKGGKEIIEFSTSPLNQFYEPFSRFHKQIEDTDVSIYAHPWGNSKFGVVTFDTSEAGVWKTHYDLVVDGAKVWEHDWVLTR
ncbi:PhoD-like phosphatase [Thozetella sp. PMI_491]|nr:PhoD-like phosphatase [Thozetella sp. PMI_491]